MTVKNKKTTNGIDTDRQLAKIQQRQVARRRKRNTLQAGGVLLSLVGIFACNYIGLGVGRAVCHGLLVVSLGAPLHSASSKRARVS